MSIQPLLVRTSKVHDPSRPDITLYRVTANLKHVGYVKKYESYIWDIESKYVNPMASSCKRKKDAVARIIEDYRKTI